jgi:hypothetical protein
MIHHTTALISVMIGSLTAIGMSMLAIWYRQSRPTA